MGDVIPLKGRHHYTPAELLEHLNENLGDIESLTVVVGWSTGTDQVLITKTTEKDIAFDALLLQKIALETVSET